MDDLISRKAAIELIERMKPYHQDADDIAEMIDNMPPAEPEPKTGHWVHKLRHSEDKQFDYYEETCSVCGAEARFWWRNFKYCPMCGAKMEGIIDDGH